MSETMYHNIFDTHSHYADEQFDADRDELLASLPSRGVGLIMLASTCVQDIEANLALAKQYDYVWAAAGFHPECVDGIPDDYIETVRRAVTDNPKVRAIGEIGLDYHYEGYDREKQIEVFERQLELAGELDMPVIIHSRDAMEDSLNIVKKYRPRAVFHCYSGSAETARELLKLGIYIGFTGVLTYRSAKKPIQALEAVPLDRLLLETDCPYMIPRTCKGRRSESSMIAATAEKAAEVKGIPVQELLDITFENGKRFYGID